MLRIKDICKKFKNVGENEIDVDIAVKNWDNYSKLYRWHDEFRLVRETHNSTRTTFKTTIKTTQAFELIEKLNLKQYNPGIFKNSSVYLTEEVYNKAIKDELIKESEDI